MKERDKGFTENLLENDFSDILGQDDVKKQLKSALLMNRHVIIVGSPGIGKTTLAKNVSRMLPKITVNDCGFNCLLDNPVCPKCIKSKNNSGNKNKEIDGTERFIRIQGSPDLTAEDLLGDIDPMKAIQFGPLSIEAFTPGKIFRANNGILFFDEINRCSEKLQNALLQVLEEKKVTIGSYTMDFPAEFIFIGTMNPEDSSTEALSDVFLDRFDMIYMDYPESHELEKQIVLLKGQRIERTDFDDELIDIIVTFIRDLRNDKNIEKKPSVRSTIGIYERSQALAKILGRNKVLFEDIKEVIRSVLGHRVRLKPSVRYLESAESYIEEQFSKHKHRKGGYT